MRTFAQLVLVAALAALPLGLGAQTTPTEEAASVATRARIDSLETRLQPTKTAEQLAARRDAGRDVVLARVETQWTSELQQLSDWIGHHPEVGWHEFQAVDTLTPVLRSAGAAAATWRGQSRQRSGQPGSASKPAPPITVVPSQQ